jgi:hypothetical protein
MMKPVTIPIVGQSSTSRSRQFSPQSTINLYPQITEAGRSPAALMCWPGVTGIAYSPYGVNFPSGINRGLHVFKNTLYEVRDQGLYKITNVGGTIAYDGAIAYGNPTRIGEIAGTGRCVFADDGVVMVIVADARAYKYDGTTFSEIVDPNLDEPNAVAFINNQWIYDGIGGGFIVSDVGDPSSLNPLNYATAEALGDDLVRPYAFNQLLYLFGEKSIEVWYNSGVGSPPFDRVEGGIIAKGISGIYCICNTDQFLYFLGDDRTVYQLISSQIRPVSGQIANAIENYGTVSDCFMLNVKLEGQDFIIMTFPTENITWCYSETTNFWFQLTSGSSGGRHLANSYAFCYGKNLFGVTEDPIEDSSDLTKYSICEFNINSFSDLPNSYYGTNAIQIKERIVAPINGELIGSPGNRIMMNKLQLIMQTGVGLANGQGASPVVMLSLSADGGETWTEEYHVGVGSGGNYQRKVEWWHINSFYDGTIRIRFSDPVFVSIEKAVITVDLAGY